jgi:hypothetical protein
MLKTIEKINKKPLVWIKENHPTEAKKLLADINSLIFENDKSLIDTIHQRLLDLDNKFFKANGSHFAEINAQPVECIAAFTVKSVFGI